jgi:hypothetical protein
VRECVCVLACVRAWVCVWVCGCGWVLVALVALVVYASERNADVGAVQPFMADGAFGDGVCLSLQAEYAALQVSR